TGLGSPMEFNNDALIRWGADFGPLTLNGQWWRIFTSMWLHGGLIHVGANMYCFWDFGRIAERVYGRDRLSSIYLTTGLASSVASLLIHPLTVSVGASGAIFGVAGALVFPFYRKRLQLPAPVMKSMLRSLGSFILINLVIGTAIPVIDNSAHVGGLLTGLLLGALWTFMAERHVNLDQAKWKVLAASLLVVAFGYAGVEQLHGDQTLAVASLYEAERGNLAKAEAMAKRAIERAPGFAYSHVAMGDVYFKRGQFESAVQEYEKAAKIDSNDAYIEQQIGASYVALNRWKEAEPPLRAALKLAPNDYIQLGLGIALAGMGKTDEGIFFVKESLKANPKSARAQFTYGSLLLAKGETQQALPPLREAVKLKPGDADYKKALEEAEARAK
ncbi:MAG TPA: rhomboid family intramembrane serine protease, partial [Terriglobales bacterium]|nr:rhomboid family intramembrane serine protease [Terriglobales bacterium]